MPFFLSYIYVFEVFTLIGETRISTGTMINVSTFNFF